ncbi:MAG: hypothetical protein EOO63_16900 [Hymenobacter sp.]|nr:MAG: hypothetical protein EOO63_16900 [Hymenobacter sp.]
MHLSRSWHFCTMFPWQRLSNASVTATPSFLAGPAAHYRGWRVTFSPPRIWLDLVALRREGYPAAILGRH